MKHKLESRLPGEISMTSDTQMTPPLWQKEESEKAGLKLNIQKTKIMASISHHFMGNRWGNSGNSVRLYFLGLQNHWRPTLDEVTRYLTDQYYSRGKYAVRVDT